MVADIKYIKTCKKKHLIPTFAKINVSIKNTTHNPRWKILLLVTNAELENKHLEKRKFKNEIKKICKELKWNLSLLVLNTVLLQICVAVKNQLKNLIRAT